MDEIELQTDRLRLRRWHEGDIEPYSGLCADPKVMQWIGDGSLRSKSECKAAIDGFERMWNEEGFGLFALETRETGEFLGFTGLAIPSFLPEVMPSVEIGWRLKRSAWGLGYATEAARAALAFGFTKCGLEQIVGVYQVGNSASGRIMTKLGMTLERETTDPSCDRPVLVYEAHSAP